ncbi:hypothetical protein BDV26DRAFT_303961 [Aspergillus bertholletiae]|uniref:Xylanolytic transcriptional activator regulatory domain-containing protein n=1 Tax=Aspergillus bertholletiae TaxID=1226010 RepID=A0A5N7BMK8_9EURO|nr:hypothetical protein BDV26DRAFT_303961 [Aspergillus bertholletiae]
MLSSSDATDGLSANIFKSPDNIQIQAALDIFFMRIYPLPGYAFLHRASLYDRLHRGQADQSLLLSIIAISTCLTETGSSKLRCKMCLGEYSSAFPLVSLLSRFAFSLKLNYDNQKVCFLAQEARRRLMWAIYMLDQAWAAGLLEFTTCPVDAIYVSLPCPEEAWELDIGPETEVQLKSQNRLPGLLAANVCVFYLRDKILRHTKRFAAGNYSALDIMYGIRELETELEQFCVRLPPSSAYSKRNLRLRAHSPWLSRFVLLHVVWHQSHCDLYRCITSGLIESVPTSILNEFDNAFVTKCRERCTDHALQIADIISSLVDIRPESSVLPMDMAICAYQCIRLLLHGQRAYGHKLPVPSGRIKKYQQSCLQIIQNIARISPSVHTIECDLKNLIDETQDQNAHPENCIRHSQQQTPRQILSIHSLIGRSEFVDDSEELALHDGHASDNSSVHEKDNDEYNRLLGMSGPLQPLPSFGLTEVMTPGPTMTSQMWLQGSNAFDGAWDEPGVGFDLIRQMQWDGLGCIG